MCDEFARLEDRVADLAQENEDLRQRIADLEELQQRQISISEQLFRAVQLCKQTVEKSQSRLHRLNRAAARN
jgi:cell division septum initiation protein DivIVA